MNSAITADGLSLSFFRRGTRNSEGIQTRPAGVVPALILAMLFTLPAGAARYDPFPESAADIDVSVPPPGRADPIGSYDYLHRLGMACDFLVRMQVSDPCDEEYGGMMEGEHLLDIVQSDNTHEAVWVWSRYRELTGTEVYDDNVSAAFEYLEKNPCYLEEGGTGPDGYYRVYNCGWALAAVMRFQASTGDTAYTAYADTAARYICMNPLALDRPTNLNGMVEAWAAGNLYRYAGYSETVSFADSAFALASEIKEWVEKDPENRLSSASWAFSSGAIAWGLMNSYFETRPWEASAWIEEFGPCLDTYAGIAQWHNAWNGWYALGHYALWSRSGDFFHRDTHLSLIDGLVSQDTELDGGIPASEADPFYQDQSWVTNYLCFMGMEQLLPEVSIVSIPHEWVLRPGDGCGFDLSLVSNIAFPFTCELECLVYLPDGSPYPGNPVAGPERVIVREEIPYSAEVEPGLVPAGAEPGIYYMEIRVFRRPGDGALVNSSGFPFEIRSAARRSESPGSRRETVCSVSGRIGSRLRGSAPVSTSGSSSGVGSVAGSFESPRVPAAGESGAAAEQAASPSFRGKTDSMQAQQGGGENE